MIGIPKDLGSCLSECPVLTLRGGTGFYAPTAFRTSRAHAARICYFRFGLIVLKNYSLIVTVSADSIC
ncbi:hypothetical protein, partial [Planktotalea frisia]|uniref:hypothetical protein n=1 Tax=Planktotalea frisia TaxID=696762 RepID=UPI001C31981D